ncbi:sigma-70 family RNA polymerase sigma factor [Streptomyces sp. NPDC046821]|uniref:sigma-70 family RNA polymerase sigma factor n=1 Tax=Streptomyces sp. NPDC046821 TaxID=3154702 RepID=UPI0033FCA191
MTYDLVIDALRPLVAAEVSAETHAAGTEPGDLEQAVWLRLLERLGTDGPPADPAAWATATVRSEARRTRHATHREIPYDSEPADALAHDPEERALTGERDRALRAAVRRLPGRCPRIVGAFLSPQDPTYREIADELGMSQGSLGPERSRCLGCLRRMLTAKVAAPEPWGKER